MDKNKIALELLAIARELTTDSQNKNREAFGFGEVDVEALQAKLPSMNIAEIARVIRQTWRPVNFGAKPYLDAMMGLDSVKDNYGMDSGKMIVLYFLSNASSWRGPVAKLVKKELNKRAR